MSSGIKALKSELQKNGLRITQTRIAVFSVLEKEKKNFLSCDEVFDLINSSKKFQCDRASVYRVLNAFDRMGLVKSSHFQGSATKYQIHLHSDECKHCDNEHEHYFKCTICHSIESIGDCFIESKLKELKKKGFQPIDHHLEISGVCPSCC